MTHRFGAMNDDRLRLTARPVTCLSAEEVSELLPLSIDGDSTMKWVLQDRVQGVISVVARRSDEVVGWAAVIPLHAFEKKAKTSGSDIDKFFVISVFVKFSARRSGVGSMLGQAALCKAKNIRSDAVVLAGARMGVEDEEVGIALYKSLGMVDEGVIGKPPRVSCSFYKKWR